MSKYTIRVGNDFEMNVVDIEDIKLLDETANLIDTAGKAKTRRNVTYILLGTILLALMVSGYLGYSDGSYNELSSVWAPSYGILAFILGSYYGAPSNK